jgi:transposase
MPNVRKESDPERLRQMAVLLEDENKRLHKQIQHLANENAALRGQADSQGVLADVLHELTSKGSPAAGHKKSRSERRRRKTRGKGGAKKEREVFGPTPQELEVVEETYEILPEHCVCGDCGQPTVAMTNAFEESEYVDVIERSFQLKRRKRQKYAKTCDCPNPIVAAPGEQEPETLGGRYGINFCVLVVLSKYVDHQPLNRQAKQMARMGLETTSQSLFNCSWLVCNRASTTYDAIQEDLLRHDLVHIDETGWCSMDVKDETRELWGMSSERGAFYKILANRSHEGAHEMLRDFEGWIITDGLQVYDKAGRLYGYDKRAGCWAHGRRYFVECEANFPRATEILDLIDELFLIEREIDAAKVKDRRAHRLEQRNLRSKPIVDQVYAWLIDGKPPPGTALEKAVSYWHGQWAKLKVFVEHPEVPLSNNAAERALRCAVIGRNN